jgi:Ser/Thr protein kinase RdoA (MazF antagonist)
MEFGPDLLAAVDTAIAAQLWRWRLPSESAVRLISVSENLTYRILPPDGPERVLRVHRSGYHTAAEIASEHAWIEALRRENAVLTPALVPADDDSTLVQLEVPGGHAPRYAALFEAAPGIEPQPADADLAFWFRQLGAISAQMHRQSEVWHRPEGFTRKQWNFSTMIGDSPIWGSWQHAVGLDRSGEQVLSRCTALIGRAVERHGSGAGRFGLIHGDPRLANLLAHEDRLWLIDFDDCGFSWFGYDAASAVSFFEHEPHVPGLLAAWSEGYRTKRRWSAEDEALLPLLVMLRRIKLLGWVASHQDAPTAQAMGAAYTETALVMAERLLVTGTTPFQ